MAEKQVTLITKENFDKEKQRVDGHFGDVDSNLLNLNSVKADKTELAKTNRSLSALWDLNEGKTYRFETDEDVAYTKDVLSGARLADLQMMGGKSLVWNQLSAFTDININGVTMKWNGDGTITLNGTATADAYEVVRSQNSQNAEHYYYYGGHSTNEINAYGFDTNINVLRKSDFIYKGLIGNHTLTVKKDITVNNVRINSPRIVDLTLMFGSGNEPTSVDDPRIAMIETYLEAHPEYNEGSIVSNEVDEVVSVGVNLLDTESYYDRRDFTYSNESLSNTATDVKDYFNLYVQCMKRDKSTFIVATSASYNTVGRKTKSFSITEPVYFGFKHNGSKKDLWAVSNETYADALLLNPGDYTLSFDLDAFNPSVVGGLKLKNIQLQKTSTATPYSPYKKSHTPIPTELQNIEGYGWGINDEVYNYVDFEPKVYHNMKSVDLGDLEWKVDIVGTAKAFYTNGLLGYIVGSNTQLTNNLVKGYYTVSLPSNNQYQLDKTLFVKASGQVFMTDSSYANADDFKQAMKGVILHYEATKGGEDYEARLFHKRVESVDLGDLNWKYQTNPSRFVANFNLCKYIDANTPVNAITSKYYIRKFNDINSGFDKVLLVYGTNGVSVNLTIIDTLYDTDVQSFKQAMQGVSLYYELATDQIYDVTDILKDFDTNIDVESGGTLTFHNKNEGYHIPIPNREEFVVKISEVN